MALYFLQASPLTTPERLRYTLIHLQSLSLSALTPVIVMNSFLLNQSTELRRLPIRPPIWFSEPTLPVLEQFGNNKSSLVRVFNTLCSLVLFVSARSSDSWYPVTAELDFALPA
jgi:hypothetical protein